MKRLDIDTMFTDKKIGVTVVISSFGRHSLLEKQINFLQHYETRLVIIDSSPSHFPFLDMITRENRDRIKYFHLPGEHNFIESVIKGLEEVSTNFFCLMGDSDIVLPEALSCVSNWLRHNPDYSAAGQVYRIVSENGDIAIQNWGHWSSELLLEDDSRTKNVSQAIMNIRTGNLVYVVCPIRLRQEIISQLSGLLQKHEEYSFRLFEHVFASTILANSKFRNLPIPLWFRCDSKEKETSVKKATPNLPLRTKEYEVDGEYFECLKI